MATIAIGSNHLILFILSILSGRILSCTRPRDGGGAAGASGGMGRWEGVIPNPKSKLLDQLREVMRLRHYSLRTERPYRDRVRRFVKFHGIPGREDLEPMEAKIELFLSHLAVEGHVAAATQNQAFNALLYLYRELAHRQLGNVQAVRTDRPMRVPTVLTVEEVKQVIGVLSGIPQLVVKLFPHPELLSARGAIRSVIPIRPPRRDHLLF